jgi:hypothetical protein
MHLWKYIKHLLFITFIVYNLSLHVSVLHLSPYLTALLDTSFHLTNEFLKKAFSQSTLNGQMYKITMF